MPDEAHDKPPPSEGERLFAEYLAHRHDEGSFSNYVRAHPDHTGELEALHADWTRVERLLADAVPKDSGRAPPIRRAPVVGDTLGPFRLLRELGRGGMGVVFEAEDSQAGRRVALKLLLERHPDSGPAGERFRREARLAAAISHPHCVFVYGAYDFGGTQALAMELMSGKTLQQVIASEARTPVQQAVSWILHIVDGLEAAHAAGVLHRDVTPANCFFAPDGGLKIGDFGLSRSIGGEMRLTRSGEFLGTPLFASPEQVRGRPLDLRSDIFSLGATFYTLLAKAPPFRAANLGETLARITGEDPEPLRQARADVPPELEQVILRCLEKEPGRRFQDYGELRGALLTFVPEGWAPAEIDRRWWAIVIDAVVLELAHAALLGACLALGTPGLTFDAEALEFGGWVSWSSYPLEILYFWLFEARCSATPGKRLLGLRIRSRDGSRARPLALLVRVAVFWCFSSWLVLVPDETWYSPLALLGLLVAPLATMRKRNGRAAPWDLLTRTRVVELKAPREHDGSRPPEPLLRPLQDADLPEPFLPKSSLPLPTLVEVVVALDPRIGRDAWLVREEGLVPADPDMGPPALRELGRESWKGIWYRVLEAPGGASLQDCLESDVLDHWSFSLRIWKEAVLLSGRRGPKPIRIEQLWIDRSGALRVIPDRAVTGAGGPAADLARQVAAELFDPASEHGQRRRRSLPVRAEALLAAEAEVPSTELSAARTWPETPRRSLRAVLRWRTNLAAVVALAWISLASALVFVTDRESFVEVNTVWTSLRTSSKAVDLALRYRYRLVAPYPAFRDDQVLLLAGGIHFIERSEPFEDVLERHLEPSEDRQGPMRLRAEALERFPEPTEPDRVVAAIQRLLQADPEFRAMRATFGKGVVEGDLVEFLPFWKACLGSVSLWLIVGGVGAVVSTLGGLLLRTTISGHLSGVGFRTRRGALVGRWRCAWRAGLPWLGTLPLVGGAWLFANVGTRPFGQALYLASGALVLSFALGTIRKPARNWLDVLSGTWSVSR